MPTPGDTVELVPEKPVVGGRMLARLDGEVVLVSGTIPGERVAARLERRQQGVLFASVIDVLEPSPDRRDPGPDPACGGMTFAHIAYERQCALKAAIVADALARVGRVPLAAPPPLTPSPPIGYRMRYRVHYRGGTLGFYREASREVCDPAHSGQLARGALDALSALAARLAPEQAAPVTAFECMENLDATERAVNLAMRPGAGPAAGLLAAVASGPGFTGVSWSDPASGRVTVAAGVPSVADSVARFADTPEERAGDDDGAAREPMAVIRRRASSFFQANRFVTPLLARKVVALSGTGPLVDLYAGVGLFALCAAWAGCEHVLAVESDRASGRDLEDNARPFGPRLRVHRATVEEFFRRAGRLDDATLIVDPPRTGMSRGAMRGILASRARKIVYVSCDVATLARDARRLLDTGYGLTHLEGLDLFPNTAHVEALAVFETPWRSDRGAQRP